MRVVTRDRWSANVRNSEVFCSLQFAVLAGVVVHQQEVEGLFCGTGSKKSLIPKVACAPAG